jgi:uncharacterized membrane protein YphA (DoxX/SURF4 family)
MRVRSLVLCVFGLIGTSVPLVSTAHTKWFATGELLPFVTTEPTWMYISAWGVIAALIIALALMMEWHRDLSLEFLKPKKAHSFERAASTFSMVAGAFFLIAGTHEYLFSPNLTHAAGIPLPLMYLQIGIGIAFLVGVFARIAALVLAFLWIAAFLFVPPIALLENLWVFTTAIFVFIMGNEYFSVVSFRALGPKVKQYRPFALPILRIGAGATLLILGFSEKILQPEYGINFLALHDWNFMQLLGMFWYSDYLFTISAGFVEALMGLLLVLGAVTRLTALAIAGFFSIPLFFLGPVELAGHLPHFAAIVLLILFGGGQHWTIFSKHR